MAIITKGPAGLTAGGAYSFLRLAKLYRQEHDTFEAYCRERWGMARNYANKIIAASAVIANLGTVVPNRPESERQARPLAKLPAEQQPLAWQAATAAAAADARPVTAKRAICRRF